MSRYLPMKIIRWTRIRKMGVACGCDSVGGNKCVIVFARTIMELSNPPTIKSSSAKIDKKCDANAEEKEVTFRDLSYFEMNER